MTNETAITQRNHIFSHKVMCKSSKVLKLNKKSTHEIHWYIADTVNSPFSLKAFSISSGYVYGGFLGAGGVSGISTFGSFTTGSSSGTLMFTKSSNLKFRSHARLAQSLSSSVGLLEHFLRLHFDLSPVLAAILVGYDWQPRPH